MKAIKVKAFQQMPSYRKPTSFAIKESYPLPPYSTIIGMVHAACGFEDYVDMEVSVQGLHYAVVNDLYIRYEFGNATKFEEGRHTLNANGYGIVRGAGNIELLGDVQLILHVKPEDENMLGAIKNGLLYPKNYLALGRWEDLLRIDEVEEVQLFEEELEDEEELTYDTYIPVDMEVHNYHGSREIVGTYYYLNKKYTKDQNGFRKWDKKIKVRHASKNSTIKYGSTVMRDSKGDIVHLV